MSELMTLMELATEIDPTNAEYIWRDYDTRSEYEWIKRYAAQGNDKMVDFCLRRCRRTIEEFNDTHLTPANVKVGDGVSICLYSDREAATIIKVTKATVTVQRDKAILNPDFKPEWIIGGFAGHCTNQEDQDYTYERDPNGTISVFYWSQKFNRYGTPGNPRLIKGRHEFYDYNF